MQVRFNQEMTCEVHQFRNNVSRQQGRYLDLKQNPELAAELPEAKEWPAFGRFIEAINRCDAFRTSGCNVSSFAPGGNEAPYVDVYFDHPMARVSEYALEVLYDEHLKELDSKTSAQDVVLEICFSKASLPDGEQIRSLRFWFIGTRDHAEEAFPLIVSKLQKQQIGDYIQWAEVDYVEVGEWLKQEAIEEQSIARENRKFKMWWTAIFLLCFGLIALCGWAGSRYGWFWGIAAAAVASVPLLYAFRAFCWRVMLGNMLSSL